MGREIHGDFLRRFPWYARALFTVHVFDRAGYPLFFELEQLFFGSDLGWNGAVAIVFNSLRSYLQQFVFERLEPSNRTGAPAAPILAGFFVHEMRLSFRIVSLHARAPAGAFSVS
jgi:hypothetical protein